VIIWLFVTGIVFNSNAQDRCGIIEYTRILEQKQLLPEGEKKFEEWLARRMDQQGSRSSAISIMKIPVVFHIIHNGEAVGTGINLSDAQIQSQIKVLNSDFSRMNADTTKTPSEFLSVAGKMNLEFILAKQSPNGTATNGIVRVKGTKNQWSINDDEVLKALSYWPAEDYLNIWVTDLASSILGYAQFPISGLPGLEDTEDNRLTDGVVLDYRIVGSVQDGSFNLTDSFNRGRTATHEIGHFLGLRHIWGDDEGACSGNGDYVDDTPDQGNSSDGCPSHPQISCNVKTMFQNYMDYTNDVCMNLYTKQQVERMLTVLENSPRRASLLTSDGLYDPAPVNNDLGITMILSPVAGECTGNIIPAITVRNNGLNMVTSATIRLSVNANVIEDKVISFSLGAGQETEIAFGNYAMLPGASEFHFEILKTNSTIDGKANDNVKSLLSTAKDFIATPFTEKFDSMPPTWDIANADGSTTWSIINTGGDDGSNATFMKFYRASDTKGEKDVLTTPVIDLSQAISPFVAFDVAYARYGNRSDGLEVYILFGCGSDLSQGEMIYSKYGSQLATVTSATGSFSPADATQWRRDVVDLSEYIGRQHIRLAFVGVNDQGNNLYIDNIAMRTTVTENIRIKDVVNPPVVCTDNIFPALIVENTGNDSVNTLRIVYFNNGGLEKVKTIENLQLASGGETTITLPSLDLADEINRISVRITHVNGFKDIDTTDNVIQSMIVVNHDEDRLPLRVNFDTDGYDAWEIVNPVGDENWQIRSTNYNRSLSFRGNNGVENDGYSWFVSPTLDLSAVETASLFFDLSYVNENGTSVDNSQVIFKVLASTDCGQNFDISLFNRDETTLSNDYQAEGGAPDTDDDWRRIYVSLSSLAGEESVRIAYAISNEILNSIYLDNIEFFLSDDPSPVVIPDLYSLYPNRLEEGRSFYLTFNLSHRHTVAYELIDMLGKTIGSKELTDVLNQTYKVDVDASRGVYLVRLLIDHKYYVSRIVVNQ
jgi:hypothetical protein